jgi:TonB family protein
MKTILIFLLSIGCFTLYGQTKVDTLYVDDSFQVADKNAAKYYRCVSFDTVAKLYCAKDYTLQNVPYRVATYRDSYLEKRHGTSITYFANGKVRSKEDFYANVHEGPSWVYYESGNILMERNYENDKVTDLKQYYLNGKVKRIEKYAFGKLTKGNCYTTEGKDSVFTPYEQMPEYVGGFGALAKFLSKNIIYPASAKSRGIDGRVIVQFVVTGNGGITNVKLISGIGGGCDEEAIRVVNIMPKWIPGKEDGKPVSIYFNLPVVFVSKGR